MNDCEGMRGRCVLPAGHEGKHTDAVVVHCPDCNCSFSHRDFVIEGVPYCSTCGMKRTGQTEEWPKHSHLTRDIKDPEKCHSCAMTRIKMLEHERDGLLGQLLNVQQECIQMRRLAHSVFFQEATILTDAWKAMRNTQSPVLTPGMMGILNKMARHLDELRLQTAD